MSWKFINTKLSSPCLDGVHEFFQAKSYGNIILEDENNPSKRFMSLYIKYLNFEIRHLGYFKFRSAIE